MTVTTADGVRLSSLRYEVCEAEVAVVFGHGFTGSQRNRKVVGLARRLRDAGLAIYTADFRGHGASGGLSTLGEREVHDLDAVVRTARERHPWIVSVGSSMGAFIALRHAGLGGDVDGVIAISSPAVARDPQLARARLLGRLVGTERGRGLLRRYGTRVGPFVPVDASPLALAANIAPVPTVIVHGTRDRYVPLDDAYALYARLGEPRRLVILPGFGHGEAAFDSSFADLLVELVAELVPPSTGETPRPTRSLGA